MTTINVELPPEVDRRLRTIETLLSEVLRYVQPDPDEKLDTAAAAAIMGIKPDSLRKLVRDGKVTVSRTPGGRMLFRREDVSPSAVARGAGR